MLDVCYVAYLCFVAEKPFRFPPCHNLQPTNPWTFRSRESPLGPQFLLCWKFKGGLEPHREDKTALPRPALRAKPWAVDMTSQDAVVEDLYLSFAGQMTRLRVQPLDLKFKDLADIPYRPYTRHGLPRKDRYALDDSCAGNKQMLLLQSTGWELWSKIGGHSLQEWRDSQTEIFASIQTIDSICQSAWNEQRYRTFGKDNRRNINCGELYWSSTVTYFLSLIPPLDHLYNHPMLKIDPTAILFLCITMLLYVGNSLAQHCVETFLIFLDSALQRVRPTHL